MIGHRENSSESWKTLPWKKFRRSLFRLQKRVYKAVQVGDKRKAKSLQKLILKSTAARLLAIRQVTQLNAGKKTAGIDGKKSLTFKERFELNELLKASVSNWKHQGLREIPIPKKDGTIRMLKIPTIADRAYQCLVKYALEPAHEATFHAKSYGFRTGRSAHDAQKQLFNNLNSRANGIDKRVIELDIEKCFDRINHTAIMDELIAPYSIRQGIFRCLKAGVNPEFPEQGTPQGGVVSPLLANIALNGIESIHRYHRASNKRITDKTPRNDISEPTIRYADDMVIILRPQDDAKEILDKISQFLANNSNYGATTKAEKLAPVVRGWRNYHRFCKMGESRNSLYHIQNRAFKVFNKETKQNRYTSKQLLDKAFPSVPYSENKHINVKGEKSPYDGDLSYWSERNSKLYNNDTSKALKRQSHKSKNIGSRMP
ncbi:MAG: reverse transcriptase N-terminal domain-containing protein [Anabaena sp. 49633_E8]|nr:reverse transcriptase N-terminal domain-containing protein [Anabaena sp. 49633_E8]